MSIPILVSVYQQAYDLMSENTEQPRTVQWVQCDFHASKILSKAGLVRDTKQPDENLTLKMVRPS